MDNAHGSPRDHALDVLQQWSFSSGYELRNRISRAHRVHAHGYIIPIVVARHLIEQCLESRLQHFNCFLCRFRQDKHAWLAQTGAHYAIAYEHGTYLALAQSTKQEPSASLFGNALRLSGGQGLDN